MTLAQALPSIGNPLKLTVKQFGGIVTALADIEEQNSIDPSDHRSVVERQMRNLHGVSRQT